jgi:glutamate racemase
MRRSKFTAALARCSYRWWKKVGLTMTVVEMTVKAYLGSFKQSGIDTLILGCTHYPLLKKRFENIWATRFAW